MHKCDQESILIAALEEGATVTAACKRAGISRMLFYRLYKRSLKLRNQIDAAQQTGRLSNEDLIKTMHMKKIRDAHWPAIRYGLEKIDEKEEKSAKGSDQSVLTIGGIHEIINMLPPAYHAKHYDHLRDLIDDAVAMKDGRLPEIPPDPATLDYADTL